MTRPRSAGQAALELLAALPVVAAAVLLTWGLITLLAATGRAQDAARAAALAARGPTGAVRVVGTVTPVALPAVGLRLAVPGRAAVRLP